MIEAQDSPDRRWLLLTSAEIFLLHSLLFGAAVLWGGTLVPVNANGHLVHTFFNPFTRGLQNWDAGWYLKIVAHGYTRLSIVFFPLFPLLIDGAVRLFHLAPLPAGLLVANLSFLVALYLFLLLMTSDGVPRDTSRRAALFLALFPTSFFFSAVYTESLFLALSLGAFLCARRGQWLAASVLAGLTALTRNPGILLLPALGWEYLLQRREKGERWNHEILYLAFIPAFLASFLFYQQVRFGDPLAFVHTDAVPAWSRLITVPGWPIILGFKSLVPFQFVYWWTNKLDDLLFTLFALVLLFLGLDCLRRSQWLYAALSFFMPLSSYLRVEPLTSMPRYIIVLFPLFLVLAERVKRPGLQLFLMVVFPAFFFLLTVLYINAYWVA